MILFWTQRAVILIHLYHMLLHIMNDVVLNTKSSNTNTSISYATTHNEWYCFEHKEQ